MAFSPSTRKSSARNSRSGRKAREASQTMQTELNDIEAIADSLSRRFGVVRQDFHGQVILLVPPEKIRETAQALRDEYGFRLLSDETAVDYGVEANPRFHVIYQMRDITRNLHIMLRVPLAATAPRVPSLAPLFPNANWLER